MIYSLTYRAFFLLLLAAFFFAWFGLVVMPWNELGHMSPFHPDEASTDIVPWDYSGEAHQGERVYASNGCAYCHTQQVRPLTSGADITRGWGTAKNDEDGKPDVVRRTFPRDYIWDSQVFLGNNRSGADLANVAYRFPDAAGLYRYLYDPYLINPYSSMPAYRFLFITRKIDGQPSDDALILTGKDIPPAGFEVVPTDQARALVTYLLSRKKSYHLPEENGPVPPPAPKST